MRGRAKGQRVGPYYNQTNEGNPLRVHRIAAGLTIEELAEKSRVSVRTIKRIEAATTRTSYGRNSYWKLSKALGVDWRSIVPCGS